MRNRWIIVLVAALLLLLVVSAAGAGVSETALGAWVIGSGGGRAESGGLLLSGTIGQAVVGETASGGKVLCAGFWCAAGSGEHMVFLPAVLR